MSRGLGEHMCGGHHAELMSISVRTSAGALQDPLQPKVPFPRIPLQAAPVAGS